MIQATMIQAIKKFFSDRYAGGPCPVKITLAIGTVVLIAVVTCAIIFGSPDRDHRLYKTSEVYTVQHDGHMFVLYDGWKEGGILHHPSCSHTDCLK